MEPVNQLNIHEEIELASLAVPEDLEGPQGVVSPDVCYCFCQAEFPKGLC